MHLLLAFAFATLRQSPAMDVPNSASWKYRTRRDQITEPPFDLKRVRSLVSSSRGKSRDEDGGDNGTLPPRIYSRLPLPDRFTYNLIHGEAFSQNCAAMMVEKGEENMIFGEIPDAFGGGEVVWSNRQTEFFESQKNHAKLVMLMRETIKRSNDVGCNVKAAVVAMRGRELIPDLVALYTRSHGDQDILSVLSILMKQGNFQPFLRSQTYAKLYGKGASYKSHIAATPANIKLTCERAMAYYKSG